MKLIISLFALLLLISPHLSCAAKSEFSAVITELNRTIVHLDSTAATTLSGLADIAVKYPKSKEVKTKVVADALGAVLQVSASLQNGFQVPEDLLPAITGLKLSKLLSAIRACGNSLKSQWEELIQNVSQTTKNSASKTKAELDNLLSTVLSAIAAAIQPLKQLLSEVRETTAEEIAEKATRDFDHIYAKFSYNDPIIDRAFKQTLNEANEKDKAEILKLDARVFVDPGDGVDAEKLKAEMEEHLNHARLLRVALICKESRKSFELKQRLFEDYEDAVAAEVSAIRFETLDIWYQLRKDYLDAQQPVIDAMEQQQRSGKGMVQLILQMLRDTEAASQRFFATNKKLRNAPTHTALKIQIAIRAAETTSASVIRRRLADSLMAENDAGLSSLSEKMSLQLEWLAGLAEQMVELIADTENEVLGGHDSHKLVLGFRKQTEAAREVAKVAAALHDATRKLQRSLEDSPVQLYLVNGVIKGALQKLLLAVLEAIRGVQDKETVGGELYTELCEKVERIVDAMVTVLIQFIFDASNGLGEEFANEVTSILDELVNVFHTPPKLEFSRQDL